MEKKAMKKSVKIGILVAVAVLLAAGVSVYASNAAGGGSISEAEAKQIALAEVKGASESDITKFKKDTDDGRYEYDVEIIYGGYEYDFEISAKDGTIFDRNKEKADDYGAAVSGTSSGVVGQPAGSSDYHHSNYGSAAGASSSADIGLERAKEIALAQVSGASAADITKAYADYDDGILEYNIEIRYNGYEYDFEINGASGNIMSKDIDHMDYDDMHDGWDD